MLYELLGGYNHLHSKKDALGRLSDNSARSVDVAHQRQLSPTIFLDKMKRIYRPMSILVRREQEKYF